MWAKVIDEICQENKISRSFYVTNATKPFISINNIENQVSNAYFTKTQRVEYAKSLISNLKKWKPKNVVIACRWSNITEDDKNSIDELLNLLNKIGSEVILINQPPVLSLFEDQNASQYFSYIGLKPVSGFNYLPTNDKSAFNANIYLKKLAAESINVKCIDVYDKMILKSKVKVTLNNDVLYFNDDHLSYSGTGLHKKEIAMHLAGI